MSYYRLFFMKDSEGPIVGTEEIAARDDVEAVRLASERVGEQAVELWCDKRKVKRFPPVQDQQSFAFSFSH